MTALSTTIYHYPMQLRDYQQKLKDDIYNEWQTKQNVCAVLPTGGGKTVVFGSILKDQTVPSAAIAHRQELVGQISQAMAREGVHHRIIGPSNVVKMCVRSHIEELGTNFHNANAPTAVAGVDTLVRRQESLSHWSSQVRLWVQDECHHVLRDNKWGKAVEMFPNARGLGVTATPLRADGKGLGRHAEGVFDTLVEGPHMRELIHRGYLTDYRIVAPMSDMDLSKVNVTNSGDYNPKKLKLAAQESHIVGDVVENYLRYAEGKLGVTFATDVETASQIAAAYNDRGVPAEVVSAKTEATIRAEIIRRFRRRELLQLVNVDLFGEGFDLPAIEVVSMARPTQSYGLYCQQFGRVLRLMDGKDKALIIDHVGNVQRHGLPDKPRIWTLNGGEKTPRMVNPDDDIPLRYCTNCTAPYERFLKFCPVCNHPHIPAARNKPEFVDGDLTEIDPKVLADMRGEKDYVDMDPDAFRESMIRAGHSDAAVNGATKSHKIRQVYQQALRESIAWWAAYQQQQNRGDSESYRRFYHTFGIDVLSAQALGKREATELANRVNQYIVDTSV